MLLSVQNGMSTPDVWSIVSVLTLLSPPVSQIAACRSLILLNPVVAILSLSPIQTTRAPYPAEAISTSLAPSERNAAQRAP